MQLGSDQLHSVGLEHRPCQFLVSFAAFHAWTRNHRDACALKERWMACYSDDSFVMSFITSESRKWRESDFVLLSQIVIARVLITDLIPFWGSLLTPPSISPNVWPSKMYFTLLPITSRVRRLRTTWDLTQLSDAPLFPWLLNPSTQHKPWLTTYVTSTRVTVGLLHCCLLFTQK